MSEWRYYAARLNGDGTETFLHTDLPLQDVKIKDVLSGPPVLSATVSPVELDLIGLDGRPLLQEWSTAIYPEKDGELRGGFILTEPPSVEGETLSIEASGFTVYPSGMPYVDVWTSAGDQLDVVREAWRHLQSKAGGNLGVTVDDTDSGVQLGTPEEPAREQVKIDDHWINRTEVADEKIVTEVTATLDQSVDTNDGTLYFTPAGKFDSIPVPFIVTVQGEKIKVGERTSTYLTKLVRGYGTTRREHGKGAYITRPGTPTRLVPAKGYQPKRLSWWETTDLQRDIEEALSLGGVDYHERHWWEGDVVRHHIDLGDIGAVKRDLRFALGENIPVQPKLQGSDDEYASEVLVLGAGEGPAMRRGLVARETDRLRRVAVLSNSGITKNATAKNVAQTELNYRNGALEFSEITVLDHPNAPLGSFGVGDRIFVDVGDGWAGAMTGWVRIVGIEISPESPSVATLSIIPS